MRWRVAGLALLGAVQVSGAAAGDLDCAAHRQDELTCLACNIYHEARDQPDAGQIAVAMVTLNRLRTADFPKSICEVVWEKGRDYRTGRTVAQFSWTLDDRPDVVTEKAAWERAKGIAVRALATLRPNAPGLPDPSGGALYFHADYVTPDWSGDPGLRLVTRIGNHLFYARTKDGAAVTTLAAAAPRPPVSVASLPDPAEPLDPALARHPAAQAVRRGAKLISLTGAARDGVIEARIYEGSKTRVVQVRRERL
ncbi:cell wall hydrolase [Azospirillum sp. sgz302134]